MKLQEIFSTVLNMSLTGSLVICFVLASRMLLRKAPKVFSYALWAVVLFRLLCPVSISSALSLLNFTRATASEPDSIVTGVDYPVVLDIYHYQTDLGMQEQEEVQTHQQQHTPSNPENEAEVSPVPDAAPNQAPAEPAVDPLTFAAYIWLVGIGVLIAYNIYAYYQLSKKITGAVRLRNNVYLADHIPSPFVLGVIRPRIYLPSVLEVSERKYIIAHERYHIRRKDHIVKLLGYTALCIHWFNPLVWVAFALSGKDMEMSCDEAVIGMYGPKIRAQYSASLLRLATGHRFIALTPLAFGEGDTKGRVMNMAKWKKPGLWVILCAVILCIGVLAACATNPSETDPQAETNETRKPEDVLQINAADAMTLCTDALEQLRTVESYFIRYEYQSDYYTEKQGYIEYRRHGNNLLVDYADENSVIGDTVYFDGVDGMFLGDFWVKEDQPSQSDPNAWLNNWSLEAITIQGMTVGQNTVTFDAAWPYVMDPNGEWRGTYTYILHNDGSLFSIQREYVLYVEGGETAPIFDSITVMDENAETTYAAIKAVADQCITKADLEERRYQAKLVSEIPSNKTSYDQDFALGAGQMRWYFHNEAYSCKLGCDNPTPTGVTVYHTEAVQTSVNVTAEENFWLEVFEDGKWRYVDENIKEVKDEVRSVSVGFYDGDRYTLDWSDTYGELKPGFYRVGRYYTARLPGAGNDTQVCYAKFRLYDENQEELIKKCRNALDALLSQKAFHIHTYEIPVGNVFSSFDSQKWKHGNNYLGCSVNTRVDGNVDINGSMLRSGLGYSLSWEDDDVAKPLRSWNTMDFLDSSNFLMWCSNFDIYDSKVIGVEEKGNQISVYMEYDHFDNAYDKTEILFTFKEDGTLASAQQIRHCHDGSTVVEASMEVLDTPAEEIKALIESQDVSKPPVFSWAEDKEKYPNAQTEGFKNTTKSSVNSMEDALWFADKECTMPPQGPAGERYNIVEIAYDADAGIWRVFLQYSQNIDGDQIIYINDDGITVMMVITEE